MQWQRKKVTIGLIKTWTWWNLWWNCQIYKRVWSRFQDYEEKKKQGNWCEFDGIRNLKAIQIVFCDVANVDSTNRSSHSEVFLGKDLLEICSKITGEHLCRSAISIKLQSKTKQNFLSCNKKTRTVGCHNFVKTFESEMEISQKKQYRNLESSKIVLRNRCFHKNLPDII